jgi:hypothetical protein
MDRPISHRLGAKSGPALKTLFVFALCFATLALSLVGCGMDATTTTDGWRTSMKGWELYSWQADGEWLFSLLEGTNREKSRAEIQAPDATLEGIDALQTALELIAPGQYVTWWSPSWVEGGLAFPSDEMIAEVERICDQRELGLSIAK